MSLGTPIITIANQLFYYSNMFIPIRCDVNLPMPGYSLIEPDIHGRFGPTIILNPTLIPDNISIIAHILSHEWGHHVLGHMQDLNNSMQNLNNSMQNKENEADAYAARFVKLHSYNVDDIINFMREHPVDLENRIQILTDTEINRDTDSRSLSDNSSL